MRGFEAHRLNKEHALICSELTVSTLKFYQAHIKLTLIFY